jgi:hypothetical protein
MTKMEKRQHNTPTIEFCKRMRRESSQDENSGLNTKAWVSRVIGEEEKRRKR